MSNDAFARRLEKNMRRLRSWAQQRAITCFRVYDRDLPEVPLALDLYENWLHATLFEPRHGIDSARVDAWMDAARDVLAIDRARAVLKRRSPGEQKDKLSDSGARITVHEAGCSLLVNLVDYVDTGLFLDHRDSRALVRKASAGKRVLNLFAYTGAFSVQAAAGGAKRTVSVDLSPTYSQWARENLALNNFHAPAHVVVVKDALVFLQECAENPRERFDWVVIDPPTVSKSKRADSFEVQRDHLRLISAAIAVLDPGGSIFFSTNFQGFVMGAFDVVTVEEVTHKTVPADFPRRPPIHRSWIIRP